jgi:hypothetical protein
MDWRERNRQTNRMIVIMIVVVSAIFLLTELVLLKSGRGFHCSHCHRHR